MKSWVGVVLGLAVVPAWGAEPVVTEEVEVRLVLVDTVVVDRSGRTVADLEREAFELFVDYEPREIDTFDRQCPDGAADDPRPVRNFGDARAPVAPTSQRRIVLAVDYMHIPQVERVEVLERLRDAVARSAPEAEEVMLVALTDILRVEQTFTADRRRLLEVLERMENDLSLWSKQFDHLHELRLFRNLNQLVDLLGQLPGNKAIVLYSNLPGPSASYDLAFEKLASKSTHARVTFFPVLARGLSPSTAPRLARLAVETGGRFTENTNDLSLGYARAQRDLACRYVIGFYDPDVSRGKARRVSVRVRQPGLTALHPDNYGFPTEAEERDGRVQSALLAPEMFDGGGVRARVFPLRPDGGRWETLVALEFPAPSGSWNPDAVTRDLAGALWLPNRIAHEFRLEIAPAAGSAVSPSQRLVHQERMRVKPGAYRLAAAVSDPAADVPGADGGEVHLPEIPDADAFVVTPILGRQGPALPALRIVDRDADGAESYDPESRFEPLFDATLAEGPLLVLSHACRAGPPTASRVERVVRRADGVSVRELPPRILPPSKSGRRVCLPVLDEIDLENLPAGDYRLEVTLTPAIPPAVAAVEFRLQRPAPRP